MIDTWPFWAPSRAEAVSEALALGGVGRGTRLIDLGCGDGQVLRAAAALGATVAGIESDPELVEQARDELRSAGIDADIRCGDLFDAAETFTIDSDTVLFAYLAPATLQRLHAALPPLRGVRLVTVDFDLPGLIPHRRSGPAQLYRLPGRRRRPGAPGWATGGTLIAGEPDSQSLHVLDVVHPGGPVAAGLSPSLDGRAAVVAGADRLPGPAHLAVDLRVEPTEPGAIVTGTLHVDGLDDHVLVLVPTHEDDRMWDLSPAAVDSVLASLARGTPPATLAAVLDATAV